MKVVELESGTIPRIDSKIYPFLEIKSALICGRPSEGQKFVMSFQALVPVHVNGSKYLIPYLSRYESCLIDLTSIPFQDMYNRVVCECNEISRHYVINSDPYKSDVNGIDVVIYKYKNND